MTFRKDYPEPGAVCCALVPVHPDTEDLMEEWGIFKAVAGWVEPHASDPGKTIITEVRQLKRVPGWATAKIAQLYMRQHEWIGRFQASPGYAEYVKPALEVELPEGYIVVNLRKVSKVSPLLPTRQLKDIDLQADPVENWTPATSDGFTLAAYLRSFLSAMDVDLEAHDSIDGRKLVNYQAAVRRDEWEHAWQLLEAPFKAQGSAYRRLFGGRRAPELTVSTDPRFVGSAAVKASGSPTLTCDPPPGLGSIPVKHTFVHFGGAQPSPRCNGGTATTLEDLEAGFALRA